MTSSVSQAHAHDPSAWTSHAKAWNSTVQQITRAPCTSLLAQLASLLPFTERDTYVLDDGAGAGMLTFLLMEKHPDLRILSADVSPGMIEALRGKAEESGIETARLETKVLDAQDLGELSDASFTHVVCSFVTNFVSEPLQALREMYRVTRPGGVVGLGTWSRVSWVPVWEKTIQSLTGKSNYRAPSLFHPRTTELDDVRQQLEEAGWADVEARTFECFHPEKTAEEATEEFYNMGNPTIQLLMNGFDDEFLKKSKDVFCRTYGEVYEGGRKRQFELAILAVGRRT